MEGGGAPPYGKGGLNGQGTALDPGPYHKTNPAVF